VKKETPRGKKKKTCPGHRVKTESKRERKMETPLAKKSNNEAHSLSDVVWQVGEKRGGKKKGLPVNRLGLWKLARRACKS